MSLRLSFRSPALLHRLLRDRRGAIAMIIALCLPLLLGFTALAVEVGLWYAEKAQGQSAVDSGSISAAIALFQGTTNASDLWYLAEYDALDNHAWANADFAKFGSPALYTSTCPPSPIPTDSNDLCVNALGQTSGGARCNPLTDAGCSPLGAEVYLWQQQSTSLAAVFAAFGRPNVTVLSHAVATYQQVNANNVCLVATNKDPSGGYGSGIDFEAGGGGTLYAPNCAIASYSPVVCGGCPAAKTCSAASLHLNGGGSITAAAILTAGDISVASHATLTTVTPPLCNLARLPPLPPNPYYNNLDPYCSSPPQAAPGTSYPPTGSIYDGTCTPNKALWPTGSFQGVTTKAATTSGTGSSSTATLTFASVPTIIQTYASSTDPAGCFVANSIYPKCNISVADSAGVIKSGTITSATALTVTISPAPTGGIPSGDTITFGPLPPADVNTQTVSLAPGNYTQLAVRNTGNVTLQPGTYYFNMNPPACPGGNKGDAFCVSGGTVQGAGPIAFVLDNGNLNLNGGAFNLPNFTALLTKVYGSPVGNINFDGSAVSGTIKGPTTANATEVCDVSAAPCFNSPNGLPVTTPGLADTVAGITIYQNPTFISKGSANDNTIALSGTGCTAALKGFIISGPFSVDSLSGNAADACTDCTAVMAGAYRYIGNVSFDTSGCDREGLPAVTSKGFGVALSE